MRIKFIHSILILFLVIFFISCEENDRTLGGYKDGYECIHNEDCGINWTCDNGVCNKVCDKDMQDNNNDGICKPSCSSDDLRCYHNHEISHCDDSSGEAVLTCVCKAGFQDNDNDGICEESCNNISISYGCDENKVVDTCDDSSGIVVTTCKCRDDYQDNDNDDICKPSCSLVTCENSTCNDSSGETTCICNDGFLDLNDGAGCIENHSN